MPQILFRIAVRLVLCALATWLLYRKLALRSAQGRHWSHRGRMLDIVQDDDGARWLLVADVRKLLPGLPREAVLQQHYGDRVGPVEPDKGVRIRADALAEYLRKSTDAASLKFKTWLDREVLGGSHNPRRHLASNAD